VHRSWDQGNLNLFLNWPVVSLSVQNSRRCWAEGKVWPDLSFWDGNDTCVLEREGQRETEIGRERGHGISVSRPKGVPLAPLQYQSYLPADFLQKDLKIGLWYSVFQTCVSFLLSVCPQVPLALLGW
jgi:hypothetical protein